MENTKILVVEDNRIVAEDIKNNLEEMGYTVCAIATSGKKALEAVKAELPDIAIMDIRLGKGMNGIDTATRLHQQYQVPIIYLTAHADKETLARAKKTEPYAYLVKPFNAEELQSAVEIAIYKHRMERKVRESRQWLQTTLTSIGDGVIATDVKGCVKFMNPVAEELTGYSQTKAVGMPLEKVYHIVNERSCKPVENPFNKVIANKQIVGLANHTVLINRDGREIPIKDSGAPIVLDDGELKGVVVVFQNDTESRLAESRLRQSQERLYLAMESAKEGLWEMNIDTKHMQFDDLCFKMLGFEPEDAGNNHYRWMLERIHTDDRTVLKKALREIVDNPNEPVNIDYRMARKDGAYMWVNSKAKIINSDGQMIVGMQRDISECKESENERRQLETKLRQSQKMEAVGTLAGGIAHDFNNILASIIGYSELSIDDAEKGSILRENLKEILVAGLRARDLVRQILTFSRQVEFELKPIKLNPLIKETLKLMRATIPSYIEIEDEITQEPVIVTANPTQIHQILVNLCTNGIHSMDGEQGKLTVRLDTIHLEEKTKIQYAEIDPGKYANIVVMDNGKGIDPKDIEKIFDPYFTTKDQGKGTGLGLSIVHGIVKSHNGQIIVESLPGHGATFSVYLPIVCGDLCARERDDSNGLARGSERILFVDDEHPIAKMQKQNLERLGYHVEIKTCAEEALAAFESQPDQYDLVITDMAMPKISGDRFSRRIKAIRPDIRVILCTGYSEKIEKKRIEELGIDGYMIKPVENAAMAHAIREVLDSKRKEYEK